MESHNNYKNLVETKGNKPLVFFMDLRHMLAEYLKLVISKNIKSLNLR